MCGATAMRFAQAVKLRTQVRRFTMRSLDALGHAPLMEPHTSSGIRTLEIGRDPIRVLLFGAGLAIGYGVTTRRDALDGPLAAALTRSGRGVVLENRAVQHVRTADAVDALGATGTHTFHVAIWFPSFADATGPLSLRAWRRQLHQMVRDVRAESSIPLVLTYMPVPTGRHLAAAIGRSWLHRVNRTIAQVAAQSDGVVATPVVPFVIGDSGQLSRDPAYFMEVAEILAPVVLATIESRTAVTAQPSSARQVTGTPSA